jgi:hypothetical protein
VAEDRRGENEVVQPINPATNAAANVPANPAANAPANALANATDNVDNNAPSAANIQGNAARTQDTMQELNLLQSRPIGQKGANVTA